MDDTAHVPLIADDMKLQQATCCHRKVTRLKLIGICFICTLTILFITKACITRRWPDRTCKFPSTNYLVNDNRKRRLPQSIIIGVKKAGTGALRHFLDLHPDVITASKEPNFFSFRYENGFDWYNKLMPLSREGQITVEKSSNNFHHEQAPGRTFEFNSTIKLIVVVREPVERAISDYTQRVINNRSRRKFEDSVFNFRTGEINREYICIRPSLYHTNLQRWLKYFPMSQIHIVDGENLKSNPYEEVYKVEEFLGLSHQVKREQFVFNATKGFFCFRTSSMVECLRDNKGRQHILIDPELKDRLKRYFRPLNELFFRQIGQRFDWS
ncbi:heparan sulfate glucosamine 3-O-sulfotransferase 1-like [Mizuhopecten yessoensis]|uniref:Heparan sulfate glucosamine 3-O-sulfotransferase 1 n=1 Tax=Mizuhopecten yessoensis TaxID=6573 RepID=A0A210QKU7_MIZYE|nr:heparan sulfate glucosamine 3-O-sulfotransferase 1-like [Mizuhopecten yessoensis]OWF49373.1 Heparan sulfate glucosamine 3-O-sulfotransferase 1 [Mizuhopecten yessoensis]